MFKAGGQLHNINDLCQVEIVAVMNNVVPNKVCCNLLACSEE